MHGTEKHGVALGLVGQPAPGVTSVHGWIRMRALHWHLVGAGAQQSAAANSQDS